MANLVKIEAPPFEYTFLNCIQYKQYKVHFLFSHFSVDRISSKLPSTLSMLMRLYGGFLSKEVSVVPQCTYSLLLIWIYSRTAFVSIIKMSFAAIWIVCFVKRQLQIARRWSTGHGMSVSHSGQVRILSDQRE